MRRTHFVLSPAMHLYTVSAVAAPIPEIRPKMHPWTIDRRMHSTPMGPTGAAMEKPMMGSASLILVVWRTRRGPQTGASGYV